MARKQQKQIPVDVDAVRMAAMGRWIEVLSTCGNIPFETLDGRHHPCPKCGGKDRFRLDDRAAGAVLCNQCFRDKNGDGFAAIQWMQGVSFIESVQLVAQQVGVEAGPMTTSRKKLAEDQLKFLDWSDAIAGIWCMRHQPITLEAMKLAGVRRARYLRQYTVFAIPVMGEGLAGDPVGYVMLRTNGGMLPGFQNKEPGDWV